MPGRLSTRISAASRLPKKSSTQTLNNSRRGTTSPAITVPDEGPTSNLRCRISAIFGDAQKTTAGHRKLIVGLRKIQESCAYEPRKRAAKGGEEDIFDEDDFNVEFARCVIRLMGVRKSEGVGDRLVRFIGFFLSHASEKGRNQEISQRRARSLTWRRCCLNSRS